MPAAMALDPHLSSPTVGLIEREVQLGALGSWLAEAAAGEGRLVFVGGEAGAGKSALVGEFAGRCRRRFRSIRARASRCRLLDHWVRCPTSGPAWTSRSSSACARVTATVSSAPAWMR